MGSQREETEFKEAQFTSARKLQLQTSDPIQTGQVWIVQEITCQTRKEPQIIQISNYCQKPEAFLHHLTIVKNTILNSRGIMIRPSVSISESKSNIKQRHIFVYRQFKLLAPCQVFAMMITYFFSKILDNTRLKY